jgi:hypothetical protein
MLATSGKSCDQVKNMEEVLHSYRRKTRDHRQDVRVILG